MNRGDLKVGDRYDYRDKRMTEPVRVLIERVDGDEVFAQLEKERGRSSLADRHLRRGCYGRRPAQPPARRLATGRRQELASPETKQAADADTRERLTVRRGT